MEKIEHPTLEFCVELLQKSITLPLVPLFFSSLIEEFEKSVSVGYLPFDTHAKIVNIKILKADNFSKVEVYFTDVGAFRKIDACTSLPQQYDIFKYAITKPVELSSNMVAFPTIHNYFAILRQVGLNSRQKTIINTSLSSVIASSFDLPISEVEQLLETAHLTL